MLGEFADLAFGERAAIYARIDNYELMLQSPVQVAGNEKWNAHFPQGMDETQDVIVGF
jgi:hypothetical protein